jgi:hypothetical protein
MELAHETSSFGTLHVYAAAPQRFDEHDVALLMPLVDMGPIADLFALDAGFYYLWPQALGSR